MCVLVRNVPTQKGRSAYGASECNGNQCVNELKLHVLVVPEKLAVTPDDTSELGGKIHLSSGVIRAGSQQEACRIPFDGVNFTLK